ncbi:hypothetical protein QFE97_02945 [Bacillus subtilis]|nr:hypothetical protein QFE97_02945 [Bacillus subtilis]
MSADAFGYIAKLETALASRGNPMNVDGFLDVLRELNDPVTKQLSTGERE